SKQRHNRKKGRENRTRKRVEKASKTKNTTPHPNTLKHVMAADRTPTAYDTSNIPSASTGFIALPDTQSGESSTLRHLLCRRRFKLIKWKGRTSRAILDSAGRVIAVLAGHPNDDDWGSVNRECHSALQSSKKRLRFMKKAVRHRRGHFPA
ncbi:hypothetical protein HYPSUDRAFT_120380, partial [Hypholoma sublateritium FD-334 SS-4]